MSVMRTAGSSNPPLADTARALSQIAKQLSEISRVLSTRVEDGSPEAEVLNKSGEKLAHISRDLEDLQAQNAGGVTEVDEPVQLRKQILDNLLRKGPALPIELAAATLSLPEEIRPVLDRMEQEGLIDVQDIGGGRLVSITAKGRAEARR